MSVASTGCQHADVEILSPWELLRKYVCRECGAVMTCACQQDIAELVLPHQAGWGVDPESREQVDVTAPLAPGVCHECRGTIPPAFPRHPHRGESSVIRRFYWYEIWTRSELRFIAWCRKQGLPLTRPDGASNVAHQQSVHASQYEQIRGQVLSEIRELHETAPRYDVSRISDAEVLAASNVAVRDIAARYIHPTIGGQVRVVELGESDPRLGVAVEEFAADVYRADGREVLFMESRPFHCLYGALMWLWVCDPTDERSRPAYFGGRHGTEATGSMVGTMLPEDFGSSNHAIRRAERLQEHLDMLPTTTDELLRFFDYQLEPSSTLRQYLWAYLGTDEARARTLIRVFGPARIRRILEFLAQSYWDRYLGWPDLLTWRVAPQWPTSREPDLSDGSEEDGDVLLVEVKSSKDRLTQDQRSWIRANAEHLQLPFEVAKVHRSERLEAANDSVPPRAIGYEAASRIDP